MPDKPLARPRILGISHIAIYTSNPDATDRFYRDTIGAVKLPDPENPKGVRYALSATQFVEVLPLPADAGINRLDHTAWNTDDAETLRRFLGSKSWKVPSRVEKAADGTLWFEVKDPEGNKVQFVQLPANLKPFAAPAAIGRHIIHVGYLVHSRMVENTFYRDLLGFKPYWFGGMADDKVDWVSQQSPDSHDWVEYMMTSGTGSGPGAPVFPPICRSTLSACSTISPSAWIPFLWPLPRLEAGNRLPANPRRRAQNRQGRQVPVQPLRPRRHPRGDDEFPRHREALLLAVHGG